MTDENKFTKLTSSRKKVAQRWAYGRTVITTTQ